MISINLLPWREEERQIQKIRFGITMALTIVCALIFVLFCHVYVKKSIAYQQERIAYLDVELGKEGLVLRELNEKKKAQMAVYSELEFIFAMRKKSHQAVQLLEGLAKVVPDAVTFNKIVRTNHTITILGKSTSNLQITQLMKNIKDISFFKDPKLEEITGKENMSGDERFFQLTIEQP
jgi:type IV pilus assembly protein PilN